MDGVTNSKALDDWFCYGGSAVLLSSHGALLSIIQGVGAFEDSLGRRKGFNTDITHWMRRYYTIAMGSVPEHLDEG